MLGDKVGRILEVFLEDKWLTIVTKVQLIVGTMRLLASGSQKAQTLFNDIPEPQQFIILET